MRIATDHRDAILQTAAKLFARKQFHEVLMDDVADKAGIAKGTIYRYFSNKNDLFAALSIQWLDLLGNEMGEIVASGAPPLDRMRQMLARLTQLVHDHDDFFQVMMRHECQLLANRQCDFSEKRAVMRDHFVTVIKEAQARSELQCPLDPKNAADMLMGMLRSLLRFSTPRPTPAETASMVMHIFVKGLGTGGRNGASS